MASEEEPQGFTLARQALHIAKFAPSRAASEIIKYSCATPHAPKRRGGHGATSYGSRWLLGQAAEAESVIVNFVNSAKLPCAARLGDWVADCRVELPMALTQTVFLFHNVPVAISRLLVLSLREYACK